MKLYLLILLFVCQLASLFYGIAHVTCVCVCMHACVATLEVEYYNRCLLISRSELVVWDFFVHPFIGLVHEKPRVT